MRLDLPAGVDVEIALHKIVRLVSGEARCRIPGGHFALARQLRRGVGAIARLARTAWLYASIETCQTVARNPWAFNRSPQYAKAGVLMRRTRLVCLALAVTLRLISPEIAAEMEKQCRPPTPTPAAHRLGLVGRN